MCKYQRKDLYIKLFIETHCSYSVIHLMYCGFQDTVWAYHVFMKIWFFSFSLWRPFCESQASFGKSKQCVALLKYFLLKGKSVFCNRWWWFFFQWTFEVSYAFDFKKDVCVFTQTYFKELAHVIVEAGSLTSVGQPSRSMTQRRADVAAQVWRHLEVECLPF